MFPCCNDCSFWILSDIEKGDTFYHTSGNAIITNLFNKTQSKLINDSTIVSFNIIGLEKLKTNANERKYLESLLLDADESIEQSGKLIKSSEVISNNVLEIRLKNAQNIERKIYLTFTK